MLSYSIWLQFQVNRAAFWTFYVIEEPLEQHMPPNVAEYLYEHHEGTIDHDLWVNRNDLDNARLFRELDKTGVDPAFRNKYRQTVESCVRQTNFYWWATN